MREPVPCARWQLIAVLMPALLLTGLVARAEADWPTVAANPNRTSWVPDEVRGDIRPVWYRPIEPYINYKTQVIAAAGRVFVSTARGMYALDADSGGIAWVYATQAPLGHSPTYSNGKLYVGSYDRTIHAIDAMTGQKVAGWNPHVALAGFETNPLVINGRVYAGNRDGYFYCLDATTGALVWRFKTDGAIRNSAALDSQNVIYFASEDLHGYALRDLGQSSQLVWKSEKMLGDSFSSYWPVVYRDWVIFSGSAGYFYYPPHGSTVKLTRDQVQDINADLTLNLGMEPGDWAQGTVTMDASPILRYYEAKPYRRRVFMLNRTDGREYTFDSNGDGRPEYAPFTHSAVTRSGAKYPPVVGGDGVLYTNVSTVATSDLAIGLSALVGWKVGTPFISRVAEWGPKKEQADDEPMAYSIGGRVAYFNLCCDREAGAFDLTMPLGQPNRWWVYWAYVGRFTKFPNYEPMYPVDNNEGWGRYRGDPQGVYARHGVQNPWVPYRGKLYRIMGNTVIAASPTGSASAPLPLATTISVRDTTPVPSPGDLTNRLQEEVAKMIAAGHLKPGLFHAALGDARLNGNATDKALLDQGLFYYSSPGDTVYALVRALPHLSATQRTQAQAYIQSEMANYPVDVYASVGHIDGAPRQAGVVAPDYQAQFAIGKQTTVTNNYPWRFPPINFYAAWKYAQVWPGEATRLYANMRSKLTVPPLVSDDAFASNLEGLNAYIAGYLGFLELERMAGQPESQAVRSEYSRLLNMRIALFSIDQPQAEYQSSSRASSGLRGFNMARHFVAMVPELAAALRASKLAEAQRAVDRIDEVLPYWFVAGYDSTHGEGSFQQPYDVSIFNAHAMILQRSYTDLVRYLDAPAFQRGDLLYIHNLVSALEAASREGRGSPNAPTGLRVVP